MPKTKDKSKKAATTKQHVKMPKPNWLGSGYAKKGADSAQSRNKKMKSQLDGL